MVHSVLGTILAHYLEFSRNYRIHHTDKALYIESNLFALSIIASSLIRDTCRDIGTGS